MNKQEIDAEVEEIKKRSIARRRRRLDILEEVRQRGRTPNLRRRAKEITDEAAADSERLSVLYDELNRLEDHNQSQ